MKNIEVYTINNCSYCQAAKRLLTERELAFREINIDGDQEKIQALIAKTGHRTMPQIFIDGEFVGGYVELKARLAN